MPYNKLNLVVYILIIQSICATEPVSQEALLQQIKELCNSCNQIKHSTQKAELGAFLRYCDKHVIAPRDKDTTEAVIPVIASDDLIMELEGDDLGENPSVEEINAYRWEDTIDQQLLYKLFPGQKNHIIQHRINEQFRLIRLLTHPSTHKMFPTIPKDAKVSYNTAVISKLNIDPRFAEAVESKSLRKDGAYLELEQAYIATTKLFLRAYDAGYPEALREADSVFFGPEMQTIFAWKKKHKKPLNNDLLAICTNIAERKHNVQNETDAGIIVFNAFKTKQDLERRYSLHKSCKIDPFNLIYCEQVYYIMVNMLIKAHDLGHPDALREAENLMAYDLIIDIINTKRKQGIEHDETQFGAIGQAIRLRKYDPSKLVASSSFSLSPSSSSSSAACSTSTSALFKNDQPE